MKITDLQLTNNIRQEDFLLVHSSNESVAKKVKALDLITNNVSTSTDNVVLVESDQFSVNVPSGQVTLIFSHLNTSFGDTIEVNMPSSPSIGDIIVVIKTITAIQNGMNYKLIFPDKYDSVYSNELGEGLEYGLSNETIVDYIVYTNFGWFLSSYNIIDTRFPLIDRHFARWDVDKNAPLNLVNNKLDLQDDKKLDYWDSFNEQILSDSGADCAYSDDNWDDTTSDLEAGKSLSLPPSGGDPIENREWRTRKASGSSMDYTTFIYGDYNPGDPNYPDAEVVQGFSIVGWFNFLNIPSVMDDDADSMSFIRYGFENYPESTAVDNDDYAIEDKDIELFLRRLEDENGVFRICLRRTMDSDAYPGTYGEAPEFVYQGFEVNPSTWYLIVSSEVIYRYKEGSHNTSTNKEWLFNSSLGIASQDKLFFMTGKSYNGLIDDTDGEDSADTFYLINRLAFNLRVWASGSYEAGEYPYLWDDIRIIQYPISEKRQFEDIAHRYGLV